MRMILFTAIVLAFATTISLASYLGTESVLEELAQRDALRSQDWATLHSRVASLEDRERRLLERVEVLQATLLSLSASPPTTQKEPKEPPLSAIASPTPVRPETATRAIDPFDELPGSLIDDRSLLSRAEQRYLEAYPPDPNLHLVRGEGGQLGLFGVRAVRDGRPRFIHATKENPEAIEQLSIALLAHERAKAGAAMRLAVEGQGTLFPSMEEAATAGRSHGGFRTIETAEGVRLFTENELLTDSDVQATLWTLEATKLDVGESPSTVFHWIDPRAIAATR